MIESIPKDLNMREHELSALKETLLNIDGLFAEVSRVTERLRERIAELESTDDADLPIERGEHKETEV